MTRKLAHRTKHYLLNNAHLKRMRLPRFSSAYTVWWWLFPVWQVWYFGIKLYSLSRQWTICNQAEGETSHSAVLRATRNAKENSGFSIITSPATRGSLSRKQSKKKKQASEERNTELQQQKTQCTKLNVRKLTHDCRPINAQPLQYYQPSSIAQLPSFRQETRVAEPVYTTQWSFLK